MKIHEMDLRGNTLDAVVVAIDRGLAAIFESVTDDEIDGVEAQEMADSLLGVGFVSAQTYILGTWSDLNKIRAANGKPPTKKSECLEADILMPKLGVTRLQLIHETANYFKHRDEWAAWPDSHTAKVVGSAGISAETEFPFLVINEIVSGSKWEFVVVQQIVKEWRSSLVRDFR